MTVTMREIIEHGLIEPCSELHAMSCRFSATAILGKDGSILLAGDSFTDIDSAMHAAIKNQSTISINDFPEPNAWKFWGFYCKDRGAWAPIEHLQAQYLSLKKNRNIRTSLTHPIRVDLLSIPECGGTLGLTFCPGKKTSSIYGGDWNRDLETDLSRIDACNTSLLVTLLEKEEFAILGIPDFSDLILQHSFDWIHLPIKDMSIPNQQFENLWLSAGPAIHQRLDSGQHVVIHCRGGIGRTGLLAARILVERGMDPRLAILNVRAVRENSIETFAQEEYVMNQLWEK